MYKKAGIVIGIVFVVIAIVIYRIGSSKNGDNEVAVKVPETTTVVSQVHEEVQKPAVKDDPPVTVDTTIVSSNSGTSDSTNTQPVQTPIKDVNTVEVHGYTKPVEKETKITEVEPEGLGKHGGVKEEVMRVSKKSLLLLDRGVGTDTDKQLIYTLDVTGTSNNVLTLYLNKKAYDGVVVGEQLVVRYVLYTNSSGVKFPVIVTTEKLPL